MQAYFWREAKFPHVRNSVTAIFLKRKIRESRNGIQYGGFNMSIYANKRKKRKKRKRRLFLNKRSVWKIFKSYKRLKSLNTVEPRYNEPLDNEVLDITNDIFCPSMQWQIQERGPGGRAPPYF